MKAIQFFAIAALGAALFASCSSEEELAQSNYPMDNVVRIMTSVDGMNTKHSHPHFTGNDKGLYATMRGGRIDPSSCLDTCWVDDMAVWWFRATCFHGLKYLLY